MSSPQPNDESKPSPAAAGHSSASSEASPDFKEDALTAGGGFSFADLNKPQWEDVHNDPKYVTASQAARILNISKFGGSAFTMFHEKTGSLPRFEGNTSTRVGHALEPLLAEFYEEETGRATEDPGDYRIYYSEDTPWLICTPDLFDDDDRVVELKALGAYARKDWTDNTGPLEYQVQNQIQLLCTGMEQGALAGLIASREFFVHDFERHDRFLKNIIPKLAEFRERCLNGDAPPVDGSISTEATLKAIHPKDTGEVVYDDTAASYFTARKEIKDNLAHMKRELILVENQIKDRVGDASELWADGMKMTWKHQHTMGGYRKAYDSRVLRGPS
jgi:predicted phage-related endonuclease